MIIREVTLLGHKDHGKSTLIGNMLILTKTVTKDRIDSAKRMSERLGRAFEPGFLLDSFEEEQEDAMTIDTTRAQIMHGGKAFEFIDVPGHEELIKNMISGASHARFAILVVSAKSREGIRTQTKRHLFIAKMMGIEKVVVCVNKMDTVGYSQIRFVKISNELKEFLERIGFGRNSVFFVPVSAYNGDNILKLSDKMEWYKGKPLLDALSSLSPKKPDNKRPLRFIFQGSIESGKKSLCIGNVASGLLKNGSEIVVSPNLMEYSVGEIFTKGKRVGSAKAGENAALLLHPEPKEDLRGMVGSGKESVVLGKREFNALVFSTETIPKEAKIRINGMDHECAIEIMEEIDTSTGMRKKSSVIRPLEAGMAHFRVSSPVCVEPFSVSEQIGRFTIYKKEQFVGLGVVQ